MDLELARYIDHTLLKPEATEEDIRRLVREALGHYFYAVCVNPRFIPLVMEEKGDAPLKVAAVVGFPLGANASSIKATEAALAVAQGADEIDMVIPIGAARAGEFEAVYEDVKAVREAVPGARLKVILETGLLSEEAIEGAARAALRAGADCLKTSTGFGPRGASLEDVRLLRAIAGEQAGVKASGGIRDRKTAWAMIEAGATRIGTSSGIQLVRG